MSEPNSTQGVQAAPEDPSYIKYLLNPQLKYKCHFLVGNEALNITVERIGVVKKMLFAHSNVLRIAVEESPIAVKDNVQVTDIYPDTFRNVLRYVYGYDNTTSLAFTDADNLLYAAEKYNILPLKGKVCSRLMSLLTYDNICGLLNNPACFQALELNAAITQILQCETDKVLSSPQFLELSPSAFLHIVQQEGLDVPEIELWRSAIRWAKNRVGSEDGASLRAELTEHVKHIRVCAMPAEEFYGDVVPSRVVTNDEIALVCLSQGTKRRLPELTQICNNIEPRRKLMLYTPPEPLTAEMDTTPTCYQTRTSRATIITKKHGIELMSLRFCRTEINCVQGTVTIKGPFLDENVSKTVTEVSVDINKQGVKGRQFDVALENNEKRVQLLPGSKYSVTVTLEVSRYAHKMLKQNYTFTHFDVSVGREYGDYVCHFATIQYKTLM